MAIRSMWLVRPWSIYCWSCLACCWNNSSFSKGRIRLQSLAVQASCKVMKTSFTQPVNRSRLKFSSYRRIAGTMALVLSCKGAPEGIWGMAEPPFLPRRLEPSTATTMMTATTPAPIKKSTQLPLPPLLLPE